MILDNRRITFREVADDVGISFGSCQAIFTDDLGKKSCGSEDCFKIAKFWAKTTSHGHRLGDVDDVQRRSRSVQTAHNWWRIMDIETKDQSFRFATIEEIKEKSNNSSWRKKARFRSILRIGKNADLSVLYLGGLRWWGQVSYW